MPSADTTRQAAFERGVLAAVGFSARCMSMLGDLQTAATRYEQVTSLLSTRFAMSEADIVFASTQAVSMAPNDPALLNNHVIPPFHPMLSMFRTDSVFFCFQASVLRKLGRFDEAKTQYEKLIAASPRNPSALSGLGKVLFDQNSFAASSKVFESVLEICGYHSCCGPTGLLWYVRH